ncbi:hypothetical protein ACFVT5_29210 [Streptomyces sp. NPDC058001]
MRDRTRLMTVPALVRRCRWSKEMVPEVYARPPEGVHDHPVRMEMITAK